MTDLDASLLNDNFNTYLERAKKYQQKGDLAMARRNYLLAGETLMKLAKISSDTLKKSRYERAKKMIDLADNLQQQGDSLTKNSSQNQKELQKTWDSAVVPNIKFSDIAGLEDVKKAITTRMINPIKYPDKYKAYNKKTGGGVLLYGPPGTGKTMIAKAIANEVNAKFYAIKGSDIVSKWVGESEKNISSLFAQAQNDDLAIIFIDEMDSLLAKRGKNGDLHNDKRVNEFLQNIDGFASKTTNLLLLGATNRPWDIDSAAMRSGRFSQKIYVSLPDAPARKFLFCKFLKNVPLAKDVDIDNLVKLSQNYSGADIEEVCDRAKEDPLLKSIKTDKIVELTNNDFTKALQAVPPSVDLSTLKDFEDFKNNKIK